MNNEINELPRTLPLRGREIAYSGKGRAPGSVVYLDAARQKLREFFVGRIATTGPYYSVVMVPANPSLGTIRVAHTALQGTHQPRVGGAALIGEIDSFAAGGLAAGVGWCLVPQSDGRHTGTVIFYRGTWGKITRDSDGVEIFVHDTQVRMPVLKRTGARVSFVAAENGRGLAAFDVRAA